MKGHKQSFIEIKIVFIPHAFIIFSDTTSSFIDRLALINNCYYTHNITEAKS